MELRVDPSGIWYHGSPFALTQLREGSTVTQWRELAEAFSHKPQSLCVEDDGRILHNGKAYGYLYVVNEPVKINEDVYPHPRTTMEKNAEFLTRRPLQVRLIGDVGFPNEDEINRFDANIKQYLGT